MKVSGGQKQQRHQHPPHSQQTATQKNNCSDLALILVCSHGYLHRNWYLLNSRHLFHSDLCLDSFHPASPSIYHPPPIRCLQPPPTNTTTRLVSAFDSVPSGCYSYLNRSILRRTRVIQFCKFCNTPIDLPSAQYGNYSTKHRGNIIGEYRSM